MNEVCFDAFTVGNHEFDDGDSGLARFFDFLSEGNCQTSVLGANIVPEVGVSKLAKNTTTDYLQPHTIVEKAGIKIGIVGIDIVSKTTVSSNPDENTKFLNEFTTAQKYVDELKSKGVNRIILLTHFQYENDIKLAKEINGVDVIVGDDSHSLLRDFTEIGLNTKGPYPTIIKKKTGNIVCVVKAWQYSQIVGKLNVSFDKNGNVTGCDGTPHMMLADSFKRNNSEGKRVEKNINQ